MDWSRLAGISEDLGGGQAGGQPAKPTLRLVALDLDGVVYRGATVLPGVLQALADILHRKLGLRYVTNNATSHRRDVAKRLAGMGLPADESLVLSSAYATALWLRGRLSAAAPIMVVGELGLISELGEVGFEAHYATDPVWGAAGGSSGAGNGDAYSLRPAAVVVGLDRKFSFATLAAAQRAIQGGALFVATNQDATFPAEERLMPGAGSIVSAVATAAGQRPISIGKPSQVLAEALAQMTGIPAKQTMFIGDRVSTDIAMAHAAGMVSVLVLTGVARDGDAHNALADYVIRDLSQLSGLLDELTGCKEASTIPERLET